MSSKLFSSCTMRGLELANRIVVSPMGQYMAENGSATEWHIMHLGHLSVSGAGLLFTEATAVEEAGRLSKSDLGLYSDANQEALARVVACSAASFTTVAARARFQPRGKAKKQ
jgi:2,4-dienoyl-CoA reductase-like NADH-dependent reductase (Old Yellow Enzyme family)